MTNLDELFKKLLRDMVLFNTWPRKKDNAQLQALFGNDPGDFSITFERTDRLVINMETARRIGSTQPAITLQIQRLEEQVGRPLLMHRNRLVAPTVL